MVITFLVVGQVLLFLVVLYLFMRTMMMADKILNLKDTMARLMLADQQAAAEVEGYTDEQVFAMRRAARELGLEWVTTIKEGEPYHSLKPKLTEYLETLHSNYQQESANRNEWTPS